VVVEDSGRGLNASATPSAPPASQRGLGTNVHVLSLAWLVAMAAAVLGPVLAHGASFGSYDLLAQYGLLQQHGVVAHNIQAGDQIDAIIPWSTLAWTQVHHGQLPLWNPYTALGLPLAFNWQTAAFSVPALIGYLFPVNLAFSVQVVLTLIVAGTGVYVLGRVLRLSVLGCVFAGTVFELSGPMVGWLGLQEAAVLSWAGWLFAAAILVLRDGHRVRNITFFAVVLAALIYAGQPEIVVLVGLALVVFLAAALALRAPRLGGAGPIRRPTLDMGVATGAGAALGAPLLWPGLQVLSGSLHQTQGQGAYPALPVHDLVRLFTQSFDGLPIAGSQWFSFSFYNETVEYVGVISLVLAVAAVALHWHRPEVVAFGVVALTMACVAFIPRVDSVLERVPRIGEVGWTRALLPLAFALAVLAGIGMDTLVRAHDQRNVRRWLGGSFALFGAGLVALWALGRGHLTPTETSIRDKSLIWPSVDTVVGLAVVGALVLAHSRLVGAKTDHRRARISAGRWAGVTLLICETVFLVSAGEPLWTSSKAPFSPTPAVKTLKHEVGSSLIGLGFDGCFLPPGIGVQENTQSAYGVQELSFYDPSAPASYFSSWTALTGQAAGYPLYSIYCPGISSASLARLYGVGFVLESIKAPGLRAPGPKGAVFVTQVGKTEDLFRIPGAAAATLTPMPSKGRLPGLNAPGRPVPVTHPDPSSWKLVIKASSSQVLRLRLTDVPGWRATIDGRPLALKQFAGIMLQAEVPAGTHTVELRYWPATFSAGLLLAAGAVVGLVVASMIPRLRRRSRSRSSRGRLDPTQPP